MDKESHTPLDRGLGIMMPLIACMTSKVRYQVSCICEEEDYPLTPEEADTLMVIHHLEGLPQSQLATVLGKDKASVTRLMNALVKSGLVGRMQDINDRRIVRACITAEGKKAFTHIFPKLIALSGHVLEGLSSEEFDTARRVLTHMMDNLSTLEVKSGKN
ncbi:MAG: MarR family transcriptional regulator [Mariprofundaceae bacterium]|nr:MarR family transcriptional regulator [Mariprofundaceae bacterium]